MRIYNGETWLDVVVDNKEPEKSFGMAMDVTGLVRLVMRDGEKITSVMDIEKDELLSFLNSLQLFIYGCYSSGKVEQNR